MPETKISEILRTQQGSLLEEWLKEQRSASSRRMDLQSEQSMEQDSRQFLSILTSYSGDGQPSTHAAEEMSAFLLELSKHRNRQGFSPSDTATFVLSFKQPLLRAIQAAHGNNASEMFKDIWDATLILDKLALNTTEAFMKVREEVIRRQQEDMLELSTPVVRLWEGVVAVPLIGTLDSNRTNMVMEALLDAIVQTRSEVAIIDITGVPTVDTLVAQHLLKTVAATRLMGADCIISGIRPQIAQTMVHLQIDLKEVVTKATLAEALVLALKRTGFSVSRSATAAAAR